MTIAISVLVRVPLGDHTYNVYFISHRVFYKRHKLIRQVIKMIVLQLLFDTQHLEHYITRKIKQFSSRVRIVDNITNALNSAEAEQVIEDRLIYLYSQPEAYYLEQLGLTKEDVKGLIKPSILSLCAESAPFVLDNVADADTDQVNMNGCVMIVQSRLFLKAYTYRWCTALCSSLGSLGQIVNVQKTT